MMAIANALAFLLYLSCSVILIRRFVQSDSVTAISFPIGIVTILALLFHGADIFFTMQQAGGWDLGLFTTLSIIAWLMAFITLLIGTQSPKAHPGMLIYPLVALSLIMKVQLPSTTTIGNLSNPALEWHILLSLAAYSLFTLAALQALVLALQNRHLRRHNTGKLMRKLPPLQTMETSLFQLITVGFILLTLGLATGALFIENIFTQHLTHKTVLSIISWCVFATLLWGRHQYGWRGNTSIKWTLIGFTFLVVAYLGSKFVLEFLIR